MNLLDRNYFNLQMLAVVTTFVLISFISPGYRTLGDGQMYLPQIHKQMYPSLLGNDLLLQYSQNSLTIFGDIVIFLTRLLKTDLFSVLFLLSVITRFIFFFSIYGISLYFTKNKTFILISPLIYIIPYSSIIGTETLIGELLPRQIALSLGLLALVFYFNKKDFLTSIVLAVTLVVHPLTTIFFLAIFYLDLFIRFYKTKNTSSRMNYIFLALVPVISLFTFSHFHSGRSPILGIFTRFDPAWIAVLGSSVSYIYELPKLLSLTAFIEFIQASIFFIIIKTELREYFIGERKRYFYYLLIVPPVLFVISIITSYVFTLAFFTTLQLSRAFVLWKIILPIMFSFYAPSKIRNCTDNTGYNFLLFGILISLVTFKLVGFIFLPGLFLIWLKEYTSNFKPTFFNGLIKKVNNSVVILLTCILILLFLLQSSTTASLLMSVVKISSLIIISWFFVFFIKCLHRIEPEAKKSFNIYIYIYI